jgi:hypothetical protein
MMIDAEGIALPDLEARAANRTAVRLEHAAAQMQNRAPRALRPTGNAA